MPRKISVAMIVKDESAHLADCLTSIKGLADEICIVDTGSRDNTIEIARKFGAKTSFFIWCNDFSAARNESLRLCTGDWVFVLDADERVSGDDLSRLRSLAEDSLDICYRLMTRNYTNTTSVGEFQASDTGDPLARGFSGWYPSSKVRFFPNNAGARFEGRVHELVHESLIARGIRVHDSDVVIHHYPYTKTPEEVLAKQEMYLKLGHLKAQAEPTNPKAFSELGDQYSDVHDYKSAAAAYRESLRLDPANPVVLKNLGGVLHILKRSEDAKKALRIAVELDPGLAEAWRNLGVVYADEKDWPLAVECFTLGIAADGSWDDGHRYLGVALEGAGRIEEAADEAEKAMAANPGSLEALKLYIHLMLRLEKRVEARTFLESVLGKGARDAEIRNALGELAFYDNLLEDAKAHFREAGRCGIVGAYNNLGVVLYREKQYEEAREAFEECLAADPGHRGARANLEKTLRYLAENGNGE